MHHLLRTLHMKTGFSNAPWVIVSAIVLSLLQGCSTLSTPDAAEVMGTESAISGLSMRDQEVYENALAILETNPSEARDTLQRLVERHPAHTGIWLNLAIAEFQLGEYQKAETSLSRVMTLDGELAAAYNLRGLLALENHDFQSAEQDFLQALEFQQDFAFAHYNLGLLNDLYRQDIEQALVHYNAYLTHHPSDADTTAWVQQLRQSLDKR